ncbi:MAG: alginate export family protein [Lautropia sp.]|nr:alginate export family protein [Lautropia sp.]
MPQALPPHPPGPVRRTGETMLTTTRAGTARGSRACAPLLCSLLGLSLLAPALNVSAQETPAPGLYLKPRVEFEFESHRNRRLEANDIRRIDEYKPSAIMALHWQSESRWAIFNETELAYEYERETSQGGESTTRLKINKLYAEARLPEWNSLAQVGRWGIEDERNWLFDDELDGVKGTYFHDRWTVEAYAARLNRWERDLLHDTATRGERSNLIGVTGNYALSKRHSLIVRALSQRNSHTDLRLTHLSIGSFASPRKGPLQHWALFSVVDGKDQGDKVSGQAIDMGATWFFANDDWQPRVTLGYAWGSGDSSSDGTHRQTGLQDNKARMGGLTKFKVYGETLNPSLSNLHVLTVGTGFAPGKNSSLDLVYHHYRQDHVAPLTGTSLRPRSDRQTSRNLGYGLDLVWGWRPTSKLRVEAVVGMFEPNDRFRNSSRTDADAAKTSYSGSIEFKYQLDI